MKLKPTFINIVALSSLLLLFLYLMRAIFSYPTTILFESEKLWSMFFSWLPSIIFDLIMKRDVIVVLMFFIINLFMFSLSSLMVSFFVEAIRKVVGYSEKLSMVFILVLGCIILYFGSWYCPLRMTEYSETQDWKRWSDSRVSFGFPRDWNVKCIEGDANTTEKTAFPLYFITDEHAKRVMKFCVTLKSNQFVTAMQAPIEDYSYAKVQGHKIWAYRPSKSERIVNIANRNYSAYLEIDYKEQNKDICDFIAENVRFMAPPPSPPPTKERMSSNLTPESQSQHK